jgi:hypothetical protein
MEYTAMKWGIALACALGLAPTLAQAQATQALDSVG